MHAERLIERVIEGETPSEVLNEAYSVAHVSDAVIKPFISAFGFDRQMSMDHFYRSKADPTKFGTGFHGLKVMKMLSKVPGFKVTSSERGRGMKYGSYKGYQISVSDERKPTEIRFWKK